MDRLIDKIIIEMKTSNSLTDDEEIVRIGLELMISKLFFSVIIAIIGVMMNCFIESILFTMSFSLLREYGGGYHAETRKKCFVLSILTLIAALSIIKIAESCQFLTFPILGIALFSVIYILIKAPIDTFNKRFDEAEIRIYGKRARVLTIVLAVAAALLWIFRCNDFTFTVLMAIIIEAYLMLKGQISNYIKREEV